MWRSVPGFVAAFIFFCAFSSTAEALLICVLDEPYAPISYPARDAPAQQMVRQAAESMDEPIIFQAAPWKRCIDGVRQGEYDAVFGASANPTFFSFIRFPLDNQGRADARRRIGEIVFSVVRRSGSAAGWDGTHFSNLDGPVLRGSGLESIRLKLESLQVPSEEARTVEQLARMVAGKRASLAIIRSFEAQELASRAEFAGALEILPQPLMTGPVYLGVGTRYYEANTQRIEALWDRIGKIRGASR